MLGSEPLVSVSSVITVISIIALIVTSLLGQLNAETRANRRRLIDQLERYITCFYWSLAPALVALVVLLTAQAEIYVQVANLFSISLSAAQAGVYVQVANFLGTILFALTTVIVAFTTFLMTRSLVSEIPVRELDELDLPESDDQSSDQKTTSEANPPDESRHGEKDTTDKGENR